MSAIYRSPFPGSPSTTLLFSYIEQTLHLLKINKFCDECCILITIDTNQQRERMKEGGRKSTFQIHSQKLYCAACIYLISFKGRRSLS